MTGTGTEATGLSGVLRLTWVTDQLAHVLEHSQTYEPAGTWTGLACPDHGLETGAETDNAILLRLIRGETADLIWEAPADFSAEHGQLCRAAIMARQAGRDDEGERLWKQAQTLWSHAWSANHQTLQLMQNAGLTRFSPDKPQRWVMASFEHHCGPHGIELPHVHNIVITSLTAGTELT